MSIRALIYVIIIALILFLLYTVFLKRKDNKETLLPFDNIFCKDKTVKEFAKDKVCQSLIEDYCQCFYNANCNIASNIKNRLVNLVQIGDKYYLHIIQEKDDKVSINIIFELDSQLYIKSIKCIKQ